MKVKGKVQEFSTVGAHTFALDSSLGADIKPMFPVYRLAGRLHGAECETTLYELLVDIISTEFDSCTVAVMVLNQPSGMLEVVASTGLRDEQACPAQVLPEGRVAGWVYTHNKPLFMNGDEFLPGGFEGTQIDHTLTSSISVPMAGREGVIGVINISRIDDARVFEERDVELVTLLSQLTAMAIENIRLHEKRGEVARIKTLFEQYVSADVARLLMEEKHDLHKIGDIQNLTVMFADLRNFTTLVQSLELKKLRSFLDDFFTMTADVVHRTGGTLNKFLGDGVLIIFGAPLHHAHPAMGAVKTARMIRYRFQKMRDDYCRKNRLFEEISLGIGVGSGETFIGNVGSPKRFDYTVVGEAVNLAQRLAAHATGDTILITDVVREMSAPEVKAVSAGTIRLKGFIESIQIHEVIDP